MNKIFNKSAEDMSELSNNYIDLVITSPPYNLDKYEGDNKTFEGYLSFLKKVFLECKRVMKAGARIAINVANLGRKPYFPLSHRISDIMNDLGFIMRGEIIWDKGASVGVSTAWGTFASARNPVLRDVHEYILVFSKGSLTKYGGNSTISNKEFVKFTRSIWRMDTARSNFHPTVFPMELPYRLIELYSFEEDIILDPFMGSGTTAIACLRTNRKYVGYEINKDFYLKSLERIENFLSE